MTVVPPGDSSAARQRYPDVVAAATRAASRIAFPDTRML
jgi:hypothetical protein